ncbi:DUF2971 domain-containing protein [Luteibacter sp. PvP120]
MKLKGPSDTVKGYLEFHGHVERVLHMLDRMSPWERRLQMRRTSIPRHFYKYRGIPPASDVKGREMLEALLLDNQLWLATPNTFNDPFDGKASYQVNLRGADLRQALERWHRRVAREGSQAAKAWVRTEDVAEPSRVERRYANMNERMRENLGVCSLSTDPANPLMWAHYTGDHRGVCVQLRPANDPATLLAHKMEYSSEYPVLSNMLEPADARAAILPVLRKSKDWEYEKEWRIVGLNEPNALRSFRPQALTAVIFGIRSTEDSRAYVRDLMDERERRYSCRPHLFQAVADERTYRIRMKTIEVGRS